MRRNSHASPATLGRTLVPMTAAGARRMQVAPRPIAELNGRAVESNSQGYGGGGDTLSTSVADCAPGKVATATGCMACGGGTCPPPPTPVCCACSVVVNGAMPLASVSSVCVELAPWLVSVTLAPATGDWSARSMTWNLYVC